MSSKTTQMSQVYYCYKVHVDNQSDILSRCACALAPELCSSKVLGRRDCSSSRGATACVSDPSVSGKMVGLAQEWMGGFGPRDCRGIAGICSATT